MLNPIHINILFKKQLFSRTPKKNLVRKMALIYIFANLFTVWLNRGQLDSSYLLLRLMCYHHVASGTHPHIFLQENEHGKG